MQIPGNFPLLLKYRLPFPVIKPFVEAGHAPRVIYAPADYSSNAIPASQGFVIGCGVQAGIGRLHLSPPVRCTRWNNAPVVVYFGNGPDLNRHRTRWMFWSASPGNSIRGWNRQWARNRLLARGSVCIFRNLLDLLFNA